MNTKQEAGTWWFFVAVVVSAIGGILHGQQQDVIRTGITMVPIDVRAFDRQGRPVTNLKADDFTIYEDGVPQKIAHFSTQDFGRETSAKREAVTEPAAPAAGAAAQLRGISPQTSRVFLIVLGRGRLQLPNGGIDGVLHFVRSRVLPQDRVAIVAYNRATDFTTDHASLVPILERYKKAHEDIEVKLTMHFSGLAGAYRTPGIPASIQADVDRIFDVDGAAHTRTLPVTPPANDQAARTDAENRRGVIDALVGDPSAGTADRLRAGAEGMSFDQYVATTVKETMDVVNIDAAINYLRNIEGEKHLIYVAFGGFNTGGFVESLQDLARAASHARVALDIVHTGGLQYRFRTSEPTTIAGGLGLDTNPFQSYLYGGTSVMSAQTAQMLAGLTGGAFHANRYPTADADLTAMEREARFQYTLGYYPSQTTADSKFRTIAVRSNRKDVTLRFRGGYYARPPLSAIGMRELVAYTRISRAFMSEPVIDDIKVTGSVSLSGEKGARTVRVDAVIDTSRITLKPANGRHAGSVEVVIFTVDGRKRQIQDLWQRIELDLSEATLEKFKASGIPHTATLAAPPDLDAVKVVVYDYAADLVGSLLLKIR
jgi:VWFA-related protein